MDFNLLADAEARSPALSLSDSGTPQHEHSCKGQDHSGECEAPRPSLVGEWDPAGRE